MSALSLVASSYGYMSTVYAVGESIVDKFLGSPLLALTVIVVIVIISLIYRRIRR